jgi:hypothetical protein
VPKLPIKIEVLNTYLGKTYRVYVHGMYWGAAPTRAKAIAAGKRALEIWDFKTMKRKRTSKLCLSSAMGQ